MPKGEALRQILVNRYYGNVKPGGRRDSLTSFSNGPLSPGGQGKAPTGVCVCVCGGGGVREFLWRFVCRVYVCVCVCVCVCACVCVSSEESSLGIDHAEEMELLLENYLLQAEELGNNTREMRT